MWASTIAPTAATISSAEVSSKANRYLVNSSWAMPLTLVPYWAVGVVEVLRPVWPVKARPIASATSSAKATPASSAATRWPRSVSTSESDESRPTSISTNRNRIMIAPV